MIEAILGVVTGLLGNVLTSVMNYKTQKLKFDHEIAKIEATTEAAVQEAKAQIQIARTEVEGKVEIAETDAYKESQKAGQVPLLKYNLIERMLDVTSAWRYITYPVAIIIIILFGFIDFLKALIRPGLTLYLTALTTWLTWTAYNILNEFGPAITAQKASDIFETCINIVVYLTVSCITWWFGDRRVAKFLMRLNDDNNKIS